MPVQVPPGHVMQQIVDENGTLRHVILSTAQHQQIHSQGSVQPHIGHYVSNEFILFLVVAGAHYFGGYSHTCFNKRDKFRFFYRLYFVETSPKS